jgi:Xaa-Pro dipeptidase
MKERRVMDLGRMRELMYSEGVNAVVATSVENVYYSTGNYNFILRLLPDRPSFAIFPEDSDPVYLVHTIEEDFAKKDSWIKDVRVWGLGHPPIACLVDILKERKLLDEKIAIELATMPAYFYQELISLANKTHFVNAESIFGKLRQIKEKGEIELLEFAAYAQRKCIESAFALAKPGWTEKNVSDEIGQRMIYMGFDEVVWRTVAAGTGSLSGHEVPTERRLETGDIVKVDCGGRLKGYYSDLARTAVVGKPSDKQKAIYGALVLAQEETIKSMNIGTRVSDLYSICKKTFEQNYTGSFRHPHIGHGLGLFLHDEPQIVFGSEKCLEENMVINIEPIYVDPGQAKYHVEDLVLITSSGPRVLTGRLADQELYVIT